MAKETKVGLLIGLALILLVGIILSDLVSGSPPVATVQEQAAGFGPQAQHNIYAAPATADRAATGAPARDPRSFERPTVVDRGTERTSVPDAFRTQPAFGQGPAPRDGVAAPSEPGTPLIFPGPARDTDRALAPPPARRPDLPEPDTREATGPRVAELPQAWRVDHDAVPGPAALTRAVAAPGNTSPPTPAADPAVSATPEDGSFFIPPPQRQEATADRGSDRYHVVGPRDSLAAVARKHYGDPSFATGIARANPGLVDFGGTLQPGDRIELPPLNSPFFRSAPPAAPEPLPEATPRRTSVRPAGTVTVAAGDTLSALAARHLGSGQRWDDLLAANSDVLERPEALREGMTLRLPGVVTPAASGRATSTAPVPATASAPTGPTYTVKAGDNLTRIATRALGDGQRWDEIFAANRDQLDNPGQVREGMVLALPAGAPASAGPAASAPTPPAPSAAAARTYTVKAGDNLTRIAARTLGDGQRWDEIFAANRDALDAPESIRVGQVLRLP